MKSESEIRPYLGAYINLARNGLFTTLRFINESVGATGGTDDSEAQIFRMSILCQPLKPEQELQARRLFFLHFPFLKYLSSDQDDLTITLGKIRKSIIAIANVLSWWRNIYSHSRAIEDRAKNEYPYLRRDEQMVSRLLPLIITASSRIIKERYTPRNEYQRGMLATNSLDFLTRNRYKQSRTPDGGKKMTLNPQHYLYPIMQGNPLPDGTNPDRLSISGKIQLICLFLEKKYITEFLSQIHFLSGFSATATAPQLPQSRIVLEVLSALRIRLPENRIRSDKDELQVALDILSELRKCPAEIYELLSARDKDSFSIQSSTGDPVLLRRNSDRFVPLALSFFDTTHAFPNLRFQINAGVFRYLFNENKRCIDGQSRIRVLQEPLNGFGRIQEVEKMRSSDNRGLWKEYKILGFDDSPRNDSTCLPYISDVYTRYVIDGNNIGMRLDGDYLPDVAKDKEGRYRVPCRKADCTISRFDLPAMLFYHLIRPLAKGKTLSTESLICNATKSYRDFFSDVANGGLAPVSDAVTQEQLTKRIADSYGILLKDIPEKIRVFLFGKAEDQERFEKHKNALILKMKEETEERLKRILEQRQKIQDGTDNKPGKRCYVQIKPGNLASYLAEDIVRFQEGTNKMTGLNYAVMQGALATFSSHNPDGRKDLMSLFKAAGLLAADGSAGTHPFLFKVMEDPLVNSTLNLYIKYLENKIQFLSNPVPANAPFLHSERVRWKERNADYYKELANRYLEQPIALSASLFEEPVKKILLGLNNDELTHEIESNQCNIAYLIQLFREYYLEDSPQCFYGFNDGDMDHDHHYHLYSLIRKYPSEVAKILKGLDKGSVYYKILNNAHQWIKKHPEENWVPSGPRSAKPGFDEISRKVRNAYKELTDTERLIRRLATQDTVLFIAAAGCVKKVLGLPKKDNSLKLFLIGREEEPSALSQRIPEVIKQIRYDWKDSTDNRVPPSHKNVAVKAANISIKDYGEIYKLIFDRRVASLVHHLDIDTISSDDLKKELDCYDNRRVGVFNDLFEYENRVLDSATVTPESPDFNDVQKLDNVLNPEEKLVSRLIRNGFCHNQYPLKTAWVQGGGKVTVYNNTIPEVADSMANTVSALSRKKE